jgi:hypothetical protein
VNKGQTGFYPGSSVARSSLSREFVNYFERDVPATVNSLFALFGALVLLFFYDVWSAAFCLVGSRIQESEKHTSRLLRSSSSSCSCSIRDHWGS